MKKSCVNSEEVEGTYCIGLKAKVTAKLRCCLNSGDNEEKTSNISL